MRVIKFLIYFITGLIAVSLIAICMVPAQVPAVLYKTSWIGNTFGGGNKWVQNFLETMYVSKDGTIYTNSVWDEAGREAGIYKNGDVINRLKDTHGWGRVGGKAIAADSKYIYMGMRQEPSGFPGQDYPPEGTNWYCVRRYNLSGAPAPFAKGRGFDRSMLIVNTSAHITGIATANHQLYVSDPATQRIRVYNTETMAELRSWYFHRPGQIAVDAQGNLWIVQTPDAKHKPQILHYTNTGKALREVIADVAAPIAIAIDSQGRLLVADNSASQQVLIYNVTGTPKLVDTFGTKGGIYSGNPGEVGDLKFNGIAGVGTDAAGNIYVGLNGFKITEQDTALTDLRQFSSTGKLQSQLLSLLFVDNADADPGTDGVDVFSKHEHFVMDYSKERGKEWKFKAFTLDKFRYPDDPRLHNYGHSTSSVFIRRLNSKRFMYITGMWADSLIVYRFDGEIAVPCTMFAKKIVDWPPNQPQGKRWLWRDFNGDGAFQTNEYEILGAADESVWGWEIDSKGDVWQTSESGVIRHYTYQGLDAKGTPIYSSATQQEIPVREPFTKLERIKYFPATDVMYLAGYTREHPQTGEEWGIVGTEIIRYDNWSKNKKIRWRIVLPYNPKANPMQIIKAMDIAGDRVFAVDLRTAQVYVYETASGTFVTKLSPGSEVANESGWVDIPYGLRAYQRTNGEYLVFVEEDAKAKVIMYRLAPTQKVTQANST